jgi:organic radical activating enzyme
LQKDCYLTEVFSSFQGEGLYLGTKQIFIRFSGCNLNCIYCDTKRARKIQKFALIEKSPGKRNFFKENNPVTIKTLFKIIKNLNPEKHIFVTLTGGEPLLQTEFLSNFLLTLKKEGIKIYLETNGTLFEKLPKILKFLDVIAMDIKLPSNLNGKNFFEEHKKFLKIAKYSEVFVKIVVTEKNEEEEFKKAVNIIKEVKKNIPLIIQPVTANKNIKKPDFKKILRFQEISQNILKDVRIIPQMHKILKIK